MKIFNIRTDAVPHEEPPAEQGFYLRPWQQDIFDARRSQYELIVACGGSGKTTLQQALAFQDMARTRYTQRQVIVGPQGHIGNQFAKKNSLRLECTSKCFNARAKVFTCNHPVTVWEIGPTFNLCFPGGGNIRERLEYFILNNGKKFSADTCLSGLVCITTHSAWVSTMNNIIEKHGEGVFKSAMKHTTVRIDESHHVGHDLNYMGASASRIYSKGKMHSTARIVMSTATPFREDGRMIDGQLKFKSHFLPLSEWLVQTGIRNIVVRLEEFRSNPFTQMVKNIKREPNEPPLCVLPRQGDVFMKSMNKVDRMQILYRKLTRALPGKKIQETIDTSNQKAVKAEILADPNSADITLTCNMVREGVDLPSVSRIHHTAMENSKWLALQTLYRMMRPFPGKDTVEITYYVPRFKKLSACKVREDFSDRINTTLLLADIRDSLDPLLLVELKSPKKGRRNNSGGGHRHGLHEILNEMNILEDTNDIREDTFIALEALVASKGGEQFTEAAAKSAVREVLDSYQVPPGRRRAQLSGYLLIDYLRNTEEKDRPIKPFSDSAERIAWVRTQIDRVRRTRRGLIGRYTPRDAERVHGLFTNGFDEMKAEVQKYLDTLKEETNGTTRRSSDEDEGQLA